MGKRGRPLKANKREVLEAGALVFSSANNRIDEITRLTGVSRPLIIHHWKDKQALYKDCVKYARDRLNEGDKGVNDRFFYLMAYDLLVKRDLSGLIQLVRRFEGLEVGQGGLCNGAA